MLFLHADERITASHTPKFFSGVNVLDLAFFHSIQSLQYTSSPTTIEDLVAAVVNSYNAINHTTLNDIFLTLQTVMEAYILHDGKNNFKTPHVYERRLEN